MASLSVPRLQTIASARDRALKSLDKLPPLSPAVGRLLSKLVFGNVDFKEISVFVEKDALLCAHILKVVNSAAFARARTIHSIQQAIMLLGIGPLRRVAVAFMVSSMLSKVKAAPSWSRRRFNLHSGATAIMSDSIADLLPGTLKEGAFLGGILHDLGRLLIAVGLPDEYEKIGALAAASGEPLIECERKTLGLDHAELSGLALSKWALPDVICKAAKYHHIPESPDAPPLAMVIHRADRFVNHLGITVMAPNPADLATQPSLEIPGYEYDMTAALERFEKESKELSQFFQ